MLAKAKMRYRRTMLKTHTGFAVERRHTVLLSETGSRASRKKVGRIIGATRSLHSMPSANRTPPAITRFEESCFVPGKMSATARREKAKAGFSAKTRRDCRKNTSGRPRETIANGLARGPMRRQLIHATRPRLTKEKKTITPRPTVKVSPKRRKASARISRKAGG